MEGFKGVGQGVFEMKTNKLIGNKPNLKIEELPKNINNQNTSEINRGKIGKSDKIVYYFSKLLKG